MVVRLQNGETATLDFKKAPSAATRNMYLDSTGQVDRNGITATSGLWVPGSPAGTGPSARGSLPLAMLLQPVKLTWRRKDSVTEAQAGMSTVQGNDFRERKYTSNLSRGAAVRRLGMQGDTLKQQTGSYAETHSAGRQRRIPQPAKQPVSLWKKCRAGNGIIYDDLANYDAVWRHPLQFRYHEYTIIPCRLHPVVARRLHNCWGCWNLDFTALGTCNTPDYIHLVAHAEQLVYADRAKWLGDPDFIRCHRTG